MACRRMATCRARFARGEQACVRCAEGKLDVEDLDDEEDNLDDEEDNLDEEEVDDTDDDDDGNDGEEEEDEVGYTSQPDGKLGAIAYPIEINGHRVPGFRVTVTEDGWDNEYVLVVEDTPGDIHDDVHYDIDSAVDRYVRSGESLYDVLEQITGRVIKLK